MPSPSRFHPRLQGLVAAFGLVMTMTGCNGTPDDSPSVDPRFSAFIQDAFAEATAGNAGEDQLSILRRVESTGTMAFADYNEAVNATFGCFTEAGIGYESISGPNGGEDLPMYYAYVSTEETDPIAEACIVEHSFWVEMLFQVRPEAVAAQEAQFERAIPSLVACLEEGGYVLPPDPSADEVKHALSLASSDEELGLTPQGWSHIDCNNEAGL